MPYPFPPDLRQLVEQSMNQGGFKSEDDLLRDALTAWKVQADDHALRESVAQMEAGQTRPFKDAIRDLCERHGLSNS
jgi:Arc/MetJ-type ribon-helix-helix transcriptional regulator